MNHHIEERLLGLYDQVWVGKRSYPAGVVDRAYVEIDSVSRRVRSLTLRTLNGQTQISEPASLVHKNLTPISPETESIVTPQDIAGSALLYDFQGDESAKEKQRPQIHPPVDKVYHDYDVLKPNYWEEVSTRVSKREENPCLVLSAAKMKKAGIRGYLVENAGIKNAFLQKDLVAVIQDPIHQTITFWRKTPTGENCLHTYNENRVSNLEIISHK